MKFQTALLILAGASAAALAQDRDLDNKNRFSIGPRFYFNIGADLKNLPIPTNAGPDYDDGYVREDSSRNAGGLTWNWGFSKTNQISGPDNAKVMEVHGTPYQRNGTTDHMNDNLQYGLEASYGRELIRFGKKDNPSIFGVEISFGGAALSLKTANTIGGPVTRVNDRYLIGDIVLPQGNVGYQGTFEGPLPPNPPSPLIEAAKLGSSDTTTEFATAQQKAAIDGTFWGFRLGPFFEIPIRRGWEVQFGAGLAVIRADAQLSYAEAFTVTGLGTPPAARNDTQSNEAWLTGVYAEARVQYWFHDVIAVYLGAQFQHIDDFTIRAANKEATVDFGSSIGLIFGVLYSF